MVVQRSPIFGSHYRLIDSTRAVVQLTRKKAARGTAPKAADRAAVLKRMDEVGELGVVRNEAERVEDYPPPLRAWKGRARTEGRIYVGRVARHGAGPILQPTFIRLALQ